MPSSTRDSLSRCDTTSYSSLYQVNNHPSFKSKMVSSAAPVKDTLELKEKLQKEALSRLRHTSKYTIAQPGFMRVGKYLFLGVMFPPYVLFYKIPKFAFVVIIPTLYSFFGKSVNIINQGFKKCFTIIYHRTQLVLQLLRKKLKIVIPPLARLGLEIKNLLHYVRQPIVQAFQWLREMGSRTIRVAKKGSVQTRSVLKTLWKAAIRVREWIIGSPQMILNAWKEGWPKIKKVFAETVQKYPALLAFAEKTSHLKQRFQASFKTSQQLASRMVNWLSDRCYKGGTRIKKQLQRMSDYYREYAAPVVKIIVSAMNHQISRSVQFLKKIGHQIDGSIQKGLTFLHSLTNKQYFANVKLNWLPHSMRDSTRQFLHHPYLQKFFQRLAKSAHHVAGYSWKGILWLFRILQQAGIFITKVLKEVSRYLTLIVKTILNYTVKILGFIGKGLRIGTYQLLVLLMMAFILMKWGFQSLESR